MEPIYKKFKGTRSEYSALHYRVRGKIAKPDRCSLCELETEYLDLANISQNYLEHTTDWMYLCQTCHKRFDSPKYKWDGKRWIKLCNQCNQWKPCLTDFYQRNSTQTVRGKTYPRQDFTSLCKTCFRLWARRQWREKVAKNS